MNNLQPPQPTSARWGVRTKRIVAIVTLAFVAFALWNLKQVFPLLIVAVLFSYLLWPLVSLIERRILHILPFGTRSLAVFISFVTVIAIFGIALVAIVPALVAQIVELGQNFPTLLEQAQDNIESFLNQPITINGRAVLFNGQPVVPLERLADLTGEADISQMFDSDSFDMSAMLVDSVTGLTGSAVGFVGGAVDILINLVFLITIVFYLTRDGDKFILKLIEITPEAYKGDMRRLLYELGQVWNAYLRGQIVLSITVGMAVYVAALVLGLPNAPILGLLSGLLEFMPNIGPFIALIPAALTALFSQSSTLPLLSGIGFALIVIFVWVAIQNVESVVLVPRVMGGSLNLHPVVVIIAVIAGASIAGALGLILAAPFTATARLLGQYIYGKLFDMDPFPQLQPRQAALSAAWIIRANTFNWRLIPGSRFLKRRFDRMVLHRIPTQEK